MFTDFTWDPRNTIYLKCFLFFHPCGRYGLLYGGKDWSNRALTGVPIRDTIKSTVAAKGIEKFKVLKENSILELETVPWTPMHVKSVNSPFKQYAKSPMRNFRNRGFKIYVLRLMNI